MMQGFFERRPPSAILLQARDLAFALIATAAFARLGYLLVTPLELVGDESYYWDWGRDLSWGYFSKPPLIAWLMAFGDLLGGGTAFGLRSLSIVLGSFSLLMVFFLTRKIFDDRAGLLAVLALLVTPANAASNLLLTIDAPLLAAWTLALWAAWTWLLPLDAQGKPYDPLHERREWEGPRFWTKARMAPILLFLALGFGLLAKQMMLVFPALTILWVVLEKDRRGWLKRPVFWLVLGLPLLVWIPPLWWNAQHDWITFQHTATHFSSGSVSFMRQVGRFFEFIGSQLGIFTPVLYVLLLVLIFRGVGQWKRLEAGERFLLTYALPGLAFVLLMAFRQRINPNWPAVFYPTLFMLLAGVVLRLGVLGPTLRWVRSWYFGGVILGLLLTMTVYSLPWWAPTLPKDLDPTVRLRGWADYGAQARNVQLDLQERERNSRFFFIVGGHRYYTSALAFYHPDQPRVYRWETPGVVHSQYEVWGLPPANRQMDAIIVWPGTAEDAPAVPDALKRAFRRWEVYEPSTDELMSSSATPERYERPLQFFIGRGWKGLP